ncbi:MAG: DNA-directed RNA polymerase subunit omega [Bacteroidia bacterium]|nr:DNA-directed RNA polymerase subunit omega [Bacteroidia bacterium]
MSEKKNKAASSTITRDVRQFDKDNGNIYESLAIIAKRANQISVDMKEELSSKLEEFQTATDNLEEMYENREQIEISKQYERMPKPTLMAIQEFLDGEIYSRNPAKEEGI